MNFKSTDDLVSNLELANSSISRTQSEITIPQYGSTDNRSETINGNQQIDSSDNDSDNEKPRDETFIERIRRAKLESQNSNKSFISTYFGIIIESILWVCVLFCTIAIPFLMILIALVHIDDCPHKPSIPIVIFITGVSMSLSNAINTADKYSPPKQESYRIRKHIVGALNFIINCFSIGCFITAAVWVYGSGKPSFTKSSPDYCNPTLYEFSFWTLNLTFVLIGFLIIAGIIGFFISYFFK